MKHGWPRKQTLFLLATCLVYPCLAVPAEAQSHRGVRAGAGHRVGGDRVAPGAPRAQAISQRPAHPRRHVPVQQPRLRPPAGFGSAANVRPGFYQQMSAPPTHHPHGGATVVPVYVYLEPYVTQPFLPAAPPIDPRQTPATAPAPAPQPIYIVTPPAAAPAAAPAPAPAEVPPPPPAPRSTEPGDVRFSIRPADAEVHLDDDYLGTGAELAALTEARALAPGVHVLEVTHPDYRPQRLVFGVTSNDSAHVLIDLAVDRIGRRSRIK